MIEKMLYHCLVDDNHFHRINELLMNEDLNDVEVMEIVLVVRNQRIEMFEQHDGMQMVNDFVLLPNQHFDCYLEKSIVNDLFHRSMNVTTMNCQYEITNNHSPLDHHLVQHVIRVDDQLDYHSPKRSNRCFEE